jgi:hypothetical protein
MFMSGARFLLFLFNANKSNEIVNWILRKSDFWVKPFFDIFSNRDVGTDGFLEPASLIAFMVYLIAGTVVLGVLNASFGTWRRSGGRRWGHA